jgi:hypothetical protein
VRIPVAPRSLLRTVSTDSSPQRIRQPLAAQTSVNNGSGPPPYNALYGVVRRSTITSPSSAVSTNNSAVYHPRGNPSKPTEEHRRAETAANVSSPASSGSLASRHSGDDITPRVVTSTLKTSLGGTQKPDLVCNLPPKLSPAESNVIHLTSTTTSTGSGVAIPVEPKTTKKN